MTTASVSTLIIKQLCEQAFERISQRLKYCDSIVDVDVDPTKPALYTGSLLKAATVSTAKSQHYKDLNFVSRLQELCDMVGFLDHKVSISLEDYSRLIALANPTKVYSPKNPYNGNSCNSGNA